MKAVARLAIGHNADIAQATKLVPFLARRIRKTLGHQGITSPDRHDSALATGRYRRMRTAIDYGETIEKYTRRIEVVVASIKKVAIGEFARQFAAGDWPAGRPRC